MNLCTAVVFFRIAVCFVRPVIDGAMISRAEKKTSLCDCEKLSLWESFVYQIGNETTTITTGGMLALKFV